MDPITAAIVAAITAGAIGGVTDVGKTTLIDAYTRLKVLLTKKFGKESDVVQAVEQVEAKPASDARKATLAEEVVSIKADQDTELLQVAQALLQTIQSSPDHTQHLQAATGNYIAQAMGGGTATIHVHASPPSLADQNRQRFLIRLRTRYHDLLGQSLQEVVRLHLQLAGHPNAVAPPMQLLSQSTHQPAHPLPAGISLSQVYTEAGHELLLLGEPGAGKSTLLLELALALVVQAERDQSQLLPVVVPLSSWAGRRLPLGQWLAEQIALLYDISPPLSLRWVREERLLPLLDGLDEMEEETRVACIGAINAYHREHLHPLVVCSRQAEYEAATTHAQFTLNRAVVVRSLTTEQVESYLEQSGKTVAALRTILRENSMLQEVATTPLMLSILILTYQSKSIGDLPVMDSVPEQQRQIFAMYIEHMLERRGTIAHTLPLDIVSWLTWLARQMREHNQTIFYLEHLQPDCLAPLCRRRYTWGAVRLPGIVIGMCASLLVVLLNGSLIDSAFLLQYAILGGFLGGLLSSAPRGSPPQAPSHSHQNSRRQFGRRMTVSVLIGLMVGLSFGVDLGPYYTLSDWLRDAYIFGVVIGLSSLLLSIWLPFHSSSPTSSQQGTARSWKRLLGLLRTVHGQRALLIAVLVGIGYGLSDGLSGGLGEVTTRLSYELSEWLLFGLHYGLIGLLLSLLLEGQSDGIALTEHLQWTWGSLRRSLLSRTHGRMALLFASIIALGYGLVVSLGAGLLVGLLYWMLLGLFQGIAREQIEDRARQVPNQGIRRSLRNSLIMGLISGSLIWSLLVGLMSLGLGYALSGGPSYALRFGVSYGWLIGASGGLATLRHYIIRLLLACSHSFPWHAPRFLEDATARILLRRVGGGYSFPHRLLLDYFADLPHETP